MCDLNIFERLACIQEAHIRTCTHTHTCRNSKGMGNGRHTTQLQATFDPQNHISPKLNLPPTRTMIVKIYHVLSPIGLEEARSPVYRPQGGQALAQGVADGHHTPPWQGLGQCRKHQHPVAHARPASLVPYPSSLSQMLRPQAVP